MSDDNYELKMYEYEKEVCRIKNEHIKFLNDAIKSSTENQCKAILTFSSASLSLSIAFIRLLQNAEYLLLLKTAWLFFVIAVLFVIYSYFIDVKRIGSEMDKIEKFDPKTDARFEVLGNSLNKTSHNIIKIAVISFGIALCLLVSFTSLNL